jgi:hypothetical protein
VAIDYYNCAKSVQIDSTIDRWSWGSETKPIEPTERKSRRRKKTTDTTPTAYLYCFKGQQATNTFSVRRRASLDVQSKGVHEPELVSNDRRGQHTTTNRSTFTDSWESGLRVNKYQVEIYKLLNRDELHCGSGNRIDRKKKTVEFARAEWEC